MQGVVVQPVGDTGVLVAATDTVRGFSRLDQAWLAAIADKLDATLEAAAAPAAAGGDVHDSAAAMPATASSGSAGSSQSSSA